MVASVNPFDINLMTNWWKTTFISNRSKYIHFCREHVRNTKDPNVAFFIGKRYCGDRWNWNLKLALYYLTIAVDGGNKDALLELGLLYHFGSKNAPREMISYRDLYIVDADEFNLTFQPDHKKAYDLLSEAAAYVGDSHPQVYHILAQYKENGTVCIQDNKKALANYQRAWTLGHKSSILNIYNMIIAEKGVELNSDMALEWLLEASETMHMGDFYLAKIYEAKENYDKALMHSEKQILEFKKNGKVMKYEFYEQAVKLRDQLKEKRVNVELLAKTVSDLSMEVNTLRKELALAKGTLPYVTATPCE